MPVICTYCWEESLCSRTQSSTKSGAPVRDSRPNLVVKAIPSAARKCQRDVVGSNPLISVRALQNELKEKGFQTQQGNPLDWQYVAKVVRKLNREKALAVDQQKVNERLQRRRNPMRSRPAWLRSDHGPLGKGVVVGCLQAPEVTI